MIRKKRGIRAGKQGHSPAGNHEAMYSNVTAAGKWRGGVLRRGGCLTRVLPVDHPFLLIIQDRENGNIHFIGSAMNPNA